MASLPLARWGLSAKSPLLAGHPVLHLALLDAFHVPVAQVGHASIIGLVGAVGGLKGPPTDELMVDKANPEAESVNLVRDRHPSRVVGVNLFACERTTAEEAHHLGIRVESYFPLEVLVGEWHQRKARGVQGPLGHDGRIVPHRRLGQRLSRAALDEPLDRDADRIRADRLEQIEDVVAPG